MIDWKTIETEYVTTDISHKRLCEKYGICRSTISKKASEENWTEKRNNYRAKTVAKSVDAISNKQANKLARIDKLTDQLLNKLEQAITELDLQLYEHTDKEKIIEYNNELRPDKPTREVIHEEKKLLEARTIIDRQGLKQIASALKDIKEVQMLKSELDRKEQEARIDKLRREAEPEKNTEAPKLVVEGLPEEFKV